MSVKSQLTLPLVILSMSTLLISFAASAAVPVPAVQTRSRNDPAWKSHPYGGTLVWGSVFPPTAFNPTRNYTGITTALQDLIFNRLVRLNADGEMEPDLARSWDISDDGRVYTFHLREGVRFHDGVELTAEDIRFTYERILDEAHESPYRPDLIPVERLECPDRYTFRVVFKTPDPLWLRRMVREVLPKHLLSGDSDQAAAFYDRPVGTGPFRFDFWDKEKRTLGLKANTDYFEGRPYLDAVRVRIYPDNSTLWAAFMRREVDLVQFINREDFMVAAEDASFRTYAVEWGMYSAFLPRCPRYFQAK